MPGISVEDLEEIFKYHAPEQDQIEHYNALREGAKTFARIIKERTPSSADQTAAIRKVREAVMTANAAVALHGKF